MERSLSLRQPPPGSAFARDTARSRSLGRGVKGLASVLGIQEHLVEVLGNSVEVFGFRWRSQLSSSGLFVFLFLNIFLGRNHGSRATNTFASLSFYSAPLPILKMLSPLSKVQEHEGEREHVCFLLPDNSKALPGTRSYCIACTPLNPNNCFALLLMLTLYNHSQTVPSIPFSSRRRALERLSRNGLLTGCTDHPLARVRLRSHLCLLAGEHTYGDEETDGNRTFSEVTILTFINT